MVDKTNPMKYLFLIFLIATMSCNCSKTNNIVETEKVYLVSDSATNVKVAAVPICIKALIKKLESEPVTNPPSKIYSYTFDGKTVYYVPPVCCDNFSDLYNDSCKIIAHPDGGFTGKGDRKAPTFHDDKKDEKLIWEDKRK